MLSIMLCGFGCSSSLQDTGDTGIVDIGAGAGLDSALGVDSVRSGGFDLAGDSDQPNPGDFAITLVESSDITPYSAKIRWVMTRPASGQVEYGPTTAYGSQNGLESRLFTEHRQKINGLQPDTLYHYRVISQDDAGTRLVSGDHTLKTPGIDQPVGWPSNTNEKQQMAGIMYGALAGGVQTGNSTNSGEHSIRFRATMTGLLSQFRLENRILTQETITQRCERKIEAFCRCVKAKVTAQQCGYMIQGYSAGTGGSLVFELRSDDGQSGHRPTNQVLATTSSSTPFVPWNAPHNTHITHTFQSGASVVAGKLYHLVIRNLKIPPGGTTGQTAAQARAKPADTGTISLNGTHYFGSMDKVDSRWSPFYGRRDSAGVLRRANPQSAWQSDLKTMPFFQYKVGSTWIHEASAGYDNLKLEEGGARVIEGIKRGRQKFRVTQGDRHVDGMWLSFGHKWSSINGKALRVELKNSSGAILATGAIAANHTVAAINRKDSSNKSKAHLDWGYTDLSSTVVLRHGKSYILEVSAPSGAGFRIVNHFPYRSMSGSRDEWKDAVVAESSTNSGSSWSRWCGVSYAECFMPITFTIVGMPKSLP